jgi:hypothetical protein
MHRPLIVCAVVSLCALSQAPSLAQRTTTTRPRPMAYRELAYLGDAALHKELKLSAEQAQKVLAFRQTQLALFPAATLRTARMRQQSEELTKQCEKFLADTLDTRQRERLRQVVLQQLARTGFRLAPPEAIAELKLTQQQLTDLAGPGAKLDAVLSKEQMQTWAKLSGAPFAQALVAQVPSRFGMGRGTDDTRFAGFTPATPPTMRLLTSEAGRKELGITDEQQKAFEGARAAWQQATQTSTGTLGSRATQRTRANAAYEQAVTAVLKPKQAERLDQILAQQEVRADDPLALFNNARAARLLGLTPQQEKDRDAVLERQRGQLTQVLLGGDDAARVREKTQALVKQTREQIEAVLTPAQRERVKGLLGQPFAIPAVSPAGRGGDRGPRTARPATLLSREVAYLGAPEFPIEMKLTAEQARKVALLRQRYQAPGGGRGTFTPVDESLKSFDKDLGEILGADRRKRFRQIVLQTIEKSAAAATTRAALSVWLLPEVAAELKITEPQRAQLSSGAAAASVLSAEQQKQWKEMKGEAFTGTLTLLPAFLGTGDRSSVTSAFLIALPSRYRYLEQASVQSELKLTPEQLAEVAKVQGKWNEATSDYRNWTAEERAARLAKANAAVDDWLKKQLQPAQLKRLEQILMQNLGRTTRAARGNATVNVLAPGFPAAFASIVERGPSVVLQYPPAAKALGLSDKQREQIDALVTEHRSRTALIQSELAHIPSRGDDLVARTQASCREEMEKKVAALLSEKQRAALKELLGEPFKGPLTRPAFGGGRGGSGGGGPGGGPPDR